LPVSLYLESLEDRRLLTGTWTPLVHLAPSTTETMLILTDGTVMVEGGVLAAPTKTWYQLKPDSSGSYVDGTWKALASMHTERLYFASNVLPDGRVFVLGGEYSGPTGAKNFTNTGEIYSPLTNTWTTIPSFPLAHFGDDPSALLPDGRILVGYLAGPQSHIYNPAFKSWSAGATKLRGDASDEETWLKLPDNSILSYDIFHPLHAQRYLPKENVWVDAGTLPAALSGPTLDDELGPAFLLPDGRAFFLGANGNTAYYSPASNTWTAGPMIPAGLVCADTSGAMLPNGHVLFAADSPFFTGPTSIFEFDPVTETYTDVTPLDTTIDLSRGAFWTRMLVLPSGEVLMTSGMSQLAVYTPDGDPKAIWRPTISAITDNGAGTYTLSGKQLNGISEGAAYGDDAEMSSNYPLVRLVDAHGIVFYARTFNWSSTGVATGKTVESTQFKLPAGFDPTGATIEVVANGIASDPIAFRASGGVSFGAAVKYGSGRYTNAMTVGDFYGDGHLDLVTANGGNDSVALLRGNGDGTFQSATFLQTPAGSGPTSLAVGDFNGDGHLDLVLGNYYTNTISVYLGNGDGTFAKPVDYPTGQTPLWIAVGHFRGDSRLDLAVADYGSQQVSVLLGNGDGTFQPAVNYSVNGNARSITVGDLSGNGIQDLVVANEYSSSTVSVLMGNGDGTFGPAKNYAAGANPCSVVLGDFNHDNRLDLAVANYGSNSVSVLRGHGDGSFGPPVSYGVGVEPICLATADLNGDGNLDLVVANRGGAIGSPFDPPVVFGSLTVLLGRGDGTFASALTLRTEMNPSVVVAADFNGDGRPDLAVSCRGAKPLFPGNVDVFLNTSPTFGAAGAGVVLPAPAVSGMAADTLVLPTPADVLFSTSDSPLNLPNLPLTLGGQVSDSDSDDGSRLIAALANSSPGGGDSSGDAIFALLDSHQLDADDNLAV
jgi:hypothetical protein